MLAFLGEIFNQITIHLATATTPGTPGNIENGNTTPATPGDISDMKTEIINEE